MRRIDGTTPVRSYARAMLVAATLTLASLRSARAQRAVGPALDSTAHTADSTAHAEGAALPQRDGWIVGPLVGLPGAGTEAAFPLATLGVGATRLLPDHMGLDFAIGTAPHLLLNGAIPIAARIGPSIPLPIGRDAFFIPSGGLSALLITGSGDAGGAIGWYTGAALVVAYKSAGLRAGATLHLLNGSTRPVWLAEIGVMHVPLPRLAH